VKLDVRFCCSRIAKEKFATTTAAAVATSVLLHTRRASFFLHKMEPVSSKSSTSRASSNPLLNTSILEVILGYVGPGHRLFLATVNKAFKESYSNVEQYRIFYWDEDRNCNVSVWCTPLNTLSSAVFSSLGCFQLAVEHGMQLPSSNSRRQQRIAGEHASIETLKTAHELGLQLTDAVVQGAAEAGSLAKLNWLHKEHGCRFDAETVVAAAKTSQLQVCKFLLSPHSCPLPERACYIAISRGDVELLCWLRENGCPWDQHNYCSNAAAFDNIDMMIYLLDIECTPAILTAMLNNAGGYTHLAAARWLRQRGAEWPALLLFNVGYDVWSGESLAWARAEGCTSEVPEVLLDGDFDD
jgi:hypothetical protein